MNFRDGLTSGGWSQGLRFGFFFACAFFCSTAPQAFFRPDRRYPTLASAETVKVGRRSAVEGARHRFQAATLTVSSTAADWMITGRKSF